MVATDPCTSLMYFNMTQIWTSSVVIPIYKKAIIMQFKIIDS